MLVTRGSQEPVSLTRGTKNIPSTKFSFFVQYGIQDGGYDMTWFNIGPYGENVVKDIWDN
jgi:hypothetical protein